MKLGRAAIGGAVVMASGGAATALAAAILLFVLVSGAGVPRTFVIDVATTGAEIRFSGASASWPLGGAVLCRRLPRPDPSAEAGAGLCDARVYEESSVPDDRIDWPDGARAEILQDDAGRLVIIASGVHGLADGSRILLDREAWLREGAFVFSGEVAIGAQMGNGATRIVLGGAWEAREPAGLNFLQGSTSEIVKSGTIRRGEWVEVMKSNGAILSPAPDGPSIVYGHLTPEEGGAAGFRAILVSAPGDVMLKVSYMAGAEPSLIRPNWIDRILTNPVVAAAPVVIALFLGMFRLAARAWRVGARLRRLSRPKPAPEAARQAPPEVSAPPREGTI